MNKMTAAESLCEQKISQQAEIFCSGVNARTVPQRNASAKQTVGGLGVAAAVVGNIQFGRILRGLFGWSSPGVEMDRRISPVEEA